MKLQSSNSPSSTQRVRFAAEKSHFPNLLLTQPSYRQPRKRQFANEPTSCPVNISPNEKSASTTSTPCSDSEIFTPRKSHRFSSVMPKSLLHGGASRRFLNAPRAKSGHRDLNSR